jgi:hypothetical protein
MMPRSIATAALALLAATLPGFAAQNDAMVPTAAAADNRLMIVNDRTAGVIFDDHHDNQFCVVRRVVVGSTEDGRQIFRRTLHCR